MSDNTALINYLKVILGDDVSQDIVSYIKSIEHEEDYAEFMDNILDKNNASHINSFEGIKGILFGKKQKNKSFNNNPSSSNNSNNNNQQKSNLQKKGKTKFKDINIFQEKKKQKEGRTACDCMGQEHEFMNNCVVCGRIHCFEEGPGECLFCGNPVTAESMMDEENNVEYVDENSYASISRSSSVETVSSCSTSISSIHIKRQPMIEECWSNIKDYRDGGGKAGKITNAILYMIARDDLPLSLTEKEGFRNLMKTVVPHYKLPSRMTVGNLIDEKYEYLSTKLKEQILNVTALSLTTDIWTDTHNTRSFLGLTGHFIQASELKSVTFGIIELDERHNAEYLGQTMTAACEEWNITSDKVVAVVADNASNMVKTISDIYGKKKYLPCFAHTLDLIASKPTKDLECVRNLVQSVRNIVTHFKHSVVAMDELRKLQTETQVPLKLIQSVCTRWNSTFYQMERFLLLSDKIASILLKNTKAPPMLTSSDLEAVKDLINIFRPIEALSKEISGEKYVTCSKIIPMVHCLTSSIELIQPKTKVGTATKDMIKSEMIKRFSAVEQISILGVATLMDPRFKKIYFRDKIACSHVVSKVKEMLNSTEIEKSKETEIIEKRVQITNPDEENNIWRFHEKLITEQYKVPDCSSSSEISLDLKSYLNEPLSDLKSTDPIKYWHAHSQTLFKNLSKVAQKSLCVVGTSVPSERLFSRTGNIITPDRNRLSGNRLKKLVFLKSLESQNWNI